MKYFFGLLAFFAAQVASAQIDTSTLAFSISGYADPYYGYDFANPAGGDRPGFIYSHNRHNEFNVNIALLKGSVSARHFRGNLALMAGTYADANLAAEPGTLKNIFEANAGIGGPLRRGGELWLDLGTFSSHIGFESAVGKDCPTLTRSIMAENSPYYETGAKLSYTPPNRKWLFSALLLNGWQRMRREANDAPLSAGWQVQFKPTDRVTLNSSSFFGEVRPNGIERTRYFHDLYGVFQCSGRLALSVGLDMGWERNRHGGDDGDFWYATAAIAHFALNDRLALAARAEYFSDQEGVLIAVDAPGGFRASGFSLGVDKQVHRNALFRLEAKVFAGPDDIFSDHNGRPTDTNVALTSSVAVWF